MTYKHLYLKAFLWIFCFGFMLITIKPLKAQEGAILIRDTEIENIFKGWMEPLLKAAALSPDSVDLILVQSSQVNAFVAGGANMFLYTGLIEKTDGPGEIIGVMAHEIGHIAGGHLIATRQAYEKASYESILGTVIGVGTAIISGNAGAGAAVIQGTGNVAQRRFLSFSRVNESSADQAGMRFMENAQINPAGLPSFLDKLESDELLPVDQQTEYTRTHPLSRNRIEALQTKLEGSSQRNTPLPAQWIEDHARIKAKLIAFTDPGRVPWVYDDADQSIAARYARAIAAYRQKDTDEALDLIDALMTEEPQNPYFIELKGQMLKEFGRVKESIPYYRKAASLLPKAGLIQMDLGHALLESGDSSLQAEAIKTLERAQELEPRSSRAHRLLATAYGRMGKDDIAKLHLAEEALLQRRLSYAKELASGALKNLKQSSADWIKANDILAQIDAIESDPDFKATKD